MTIDLEDLNRVVKTALEEDLRYGPDATTEATVPEDAIATATIAPRAFGTVAGIPAVRAVFDEVIGEYEVLSTMEDGARVRPGDDVLVVRAPVRRLLTAERTALNLLCHLSGVATATAEWVEAVAGTGVAIRDSRKTLPGLRLLEKYAVRCGGGVNHRFGLDDAILIKDNHVAACGGIAEALKRARAAAGHLMKVEVEVDSLDQLAQALPHGPDVIMLDNFNLADLARAVAIAAGGPPLEASGGVNLQTVRAIAETGVDVISVGALTHSAPVLDIGLDAV